MRRGNGTNVQILTKGDNNPTDDRWLFKHYGRNATWIGMEHVQGRVVGSMRGVGYLTLWIDDSVGLPGRVILIALFCGLVLYSKFSDVGLAIADTQEKVSYCKTLQQLVDTLNEQASALKAQINAANHRSKANLN